MDHESRNMSLNNQPYQFRPTHIDGNSIESLYCPFVVSISQCGESCNSQIYVPDEERKCQPKSI